MKRNTLPNFLSKCALAGLGLALMASPALAEEGGTGHATPGGVATMTDAAPTKPGWVIEPMYINYHGDFNAKNLIPIGGLESLGLSATADVFVLGALYTVKKKLWGAYYSAGAFLPYMSLDVVGKVNDTVVRDSVSGISDLTMIPVMLAWKNEAWQYTASLSIYAPTGEYNVGELAQLGLNYWTADPMIGAQYSNPETGFNFGINTGMTFNTENNDTNYDSGSMFHIEATIQQILPVGKGYLTLGLDAFYWQQVTDDSGAGAKFDFKGRTMGIGPVVSYILPVDSNTLVFEAKWLPESNVEKRIKGDYLWFKLVYQFE